MTAAWVSPDHLRGWFDASRRLAEVLSLGRGVRLGETTVASRCVHTIDPSRPWLLQIIADADAGQVFYRRLRPGQVLHLDVFHELGEVDHRAVARHFRLAAEAFLTGSGEVADGRSVDRLLDYVDLQTATGGGRASGSLTFGRRESLRRAHLSHVHVAIGPVAGETLLALHIVEAAERAVLEQGLELRRIDAIVHEAGGRTPLDLSPYADDNDSRLREPKASAAAVGKPVGLGDALRLARQFEGVEEMKAFLSALGRGPAEIVRDRRWRSFGHDLLPELEAAGIVFRESRGWSLTETGRALDRFVNQHLGELRAEFRLLLRRLPSRGRISFDVASGPPHGALGRRGRVASVEPLPSGGWLSELAAPESIVAAIHRSGLAGEGLRLTRGDLRQVRRAGRRRTDICLVLDASASMAGARLRAAKNLARHLCLATRQRLAVIAFQERDVWLAVPFTRSIDQVDQGLGTVEALGLTPLADGLDRALAYLHSCRARDPLLLLITDGIPTVPRWSINPLDDALRVGERVAAARISFGCVGLQPNRRFLEELVRRSGGALYIVDELEHEDLTAIAHRELRRASQARA